MGSLGAPWGAPRVRGGSGGAPWGFLEALGAPWGAPGGAKGDLRDAQRTAKRAQLAQNAIGVIKIEGATGAAKNTDFRLCTPLGYKADLPPKRAQNARVVKATCELTTQGGT